MQSSSGTLHLAKNKFSNSSHSPARGYACHPATRNSTGAELVLIRGLPGSGKSTMAKTLAMVGYEHYEADQFFEVDGVYHYDPLRIRKAHEWCQNRTRQALAAGKRVVVSNTFTRLQEMEPYLPLTLNFRVIEARGNWNNQHSVPVNTLAWMAERWEELPAAWAAH